MPKMSEINVQKSRYFKVADLVEATGKPWARAQLQATIKSAEIGEYPSDGDTAAQDAYLIHLVGHEKPLGCNLTNRKVLAGIVGDVEWDTANLSGTHLIIYAESTSMGEGIRIRYNPAGDATDSPKGNPVRDEDPPPVREDDNIPF